MHKQNKANAKTVPTTFWTQIWEPEMDFDDDFNHVAQTLQIQMFQFILDILHTSNCPGMLPKHDLSASLKHCKTNKNQSKWPFIHIPEDQNLQNRSAL